MCHIQASLVNFHASCVMCYVLRVACQISPVLNKPCFYSPPTVSADKLVCAFLFVKQKEFTDTFLCSIVNKQPPNNGANAIPGHEALH